MGKKKVVQKSEKEVIEESEKFLKRTPTSAAPTKLKVENGRIYIQTSYNNIIITVADTSGNVLCWLSAGSIGFSGPKKATPFAASKVAEAIVEKIRRTGPINVEVYIKGVGKGRDAALRSLTSSGLNITLIKDVTPIPHNGPRPPKIRRV